MILKLYKGRVLFSNTIVSGFSLAVVKSYNEAISSEGQTGYQLI